MRRRPLRTQFARAAERMSPDDAFDMDAEVAITYADFPELKGNTYFVDVAHNRLVHPHPNKLMKRKVMGNAHVKAEIEKVARSKNCFYESRHVLKTPFNVVFLYLEDDAPTLKDALPGYTATQEKRRLIDHEVGHALTLRTDRDLHKYGMLNIVFENLAEDFMLLRQFQRYGNDNPRIQAHNLVAQGASCLLLSEPAQEHYFAAPSMERILSMKERMKDDFDISALSPRATLDLARKVALQYTPSAFAIEQLKKELKGRKNGETLFGLAKRTLATQSEEAFKWGSMAIRFEMRDEALLHGDKAKFRDRHWRSISKKLNLRQDEFGVSPSSGRRA